eukprot:TRINITY_DN5433_c0_g1_i2.p1 TRINITY_DN5433_c0_g1~~TRINITY_DN5433_c0_g1_i2.p1  ORF type:complete len:349 (-),score=93.79 TRINITY_DN5433_c0_g1_i2:31-1077(-)
MTNREQQYLSEIDGLKQSLSDLQNEYENVLQVNNEWEEQCLELRQEVATMKMELDSAVSGSIKWKGAAENTELEKRSLVTQLQNLQSSTKTGPTPDLRLLQERALKAEAEKDELSDKLTRLIAAVKKERATVKIQMDDLQAHKEALTRDLDRLRQSLPNASPPPLPQTTDQDEIYALKRSLAAADQRIRDAEARADKLVLELESQTQVTSPPPSLDDDPILPADDEMGGPPPPPPPPAVKNIDSTKLNIIKKSGSSDAAPKKRDDGQDLTNLIEEIRKGVKLRPTGNFTKRPSVRENVDIGSLGSMASELAKQRQQRIMNQNKTATKKKRQDRESKLLSDLLRDLDNL